MEPIQDDQQGIPHTHREFQDWCFRCHLSRDEANVEPIQDDIETPYEPFDQDRLTYPWRHDAIKAWEDAHGHDIRLKCYVEFGCQVIEPTLERRIDRLVTERDRLIQALNDIACWKEGREVDGGFDEPASARIAREALTKKDA